MVRASIVALALVTTACASQVMQGFVGEPVQIVMASRGPPTTAFDMGDGRRAFQWIKTRSGSTPINVQNSGTAHPVGNSVWWTQNTQISGGQPIQSECVYTLYGRWNEGANAWVIESFEKPRLLCE